MADGLLFSDLKNSGFVKLKSVEEIAKHQFKNENTKFNADALAAFTDVIKVFIAEAATRAAYEAKKDTPFEVVVIKEHLEKILPQLLLQF